MKGFIKQTVLALGCAAAFVATQGCGGYHNIVDPCYPNGLAINPKTSTAKPYRQRCEIIILLNPEYSTTLSRGG